MTQVQLFILIFTFAFCLGEIFQDLYRFFMMM